MDNKPKVSIIIPNYNYAKYLRKCIDSVLNQTYANIELIIVDDGSTDNSREVIESYVDHRIIKIYQENQGVSVARNNGIQIANGSYLAFLDSDDYWSPNKIEENLLLLQTGEYQIVYSGVRKFDLMDRTLENLIPSVSGNIYKLYNKYPGRAHIFAATSNCIFSNDSDFIIPKFNPKLASSADWDFMRKVTMGRNVTYQKDLHVNYRVHTESMSQFSFRKYFLDNQKAIFLFIFNPLKLSDFLPNLFFGLAASAKLFYALIRLLKNNIFKSLSITRGSKYG